MPRFLISALTKHLAVPQAGLARVLLLSRVTRIKGKLRKVSNDVEAVQD